MTADVSEGPRPGPEARSRRSTSALDAIVVVASVIAFAVSFFAYYSYDAKSPATRACSKLHAYPRNAHYPLRQLCAGDAASAWHGVFGWLAVLLALIGGCAVAVAAFAPRLTRSVPPQVIALGAYLLAVVLTLVAAATVPEWPLAPRLHLTRAEYARGVDAGHAYGYWVVLGLLVLAAALYYLRFQRSGVQLQGRRRTFATADGGRSAGMPPG